MVSKILSIELVDNPNSVPYWAGQQVSIRVHVVLSKECRIKGIKVTSLGKAKVSLKATTRYFTICGGSRVIRSFEVAEEIYLNSAAYIFGTGNSNEVLSPGHHQIPFQITLPQGLPSTYRDDYSVVEYEMKAEMERVWWKSNCHARVELKVRGILDLNTHPRAFEAAEIRNEATVTCLWCKSGPIMFYMRLPRRGYVPGEYISGVAQLHNLSKNRVKRVKVSLIQKRIYIANGHEKSSKKKICKASTPPVEPGETKIWSENILYIPPLPPTSLANCKIIDIQYMIKILIEISGLTSNLKNEINPIIIGTIPMEDPPVTENIYYDSSIV